jgi:hypothetical protein
MAARRARMATLTQFHRRRQARICRPRIPHRIPPAGFQSQGSRPRLRKAPYSDRETPPAVRLRFRRQCACDSSAPSLPAAGTLSAGFPRANGGGRSTARRAPGAKRTAAPSRARWTGRSRWRAGSSRLKRGAYPAAVPVTPVLLEEGGRGSARHYSVPTLALRPGPAADCSATRRTGAPGSPDRGNLFHTRIPVSGPDTRPQNRRFIIQPRTWAMRTVTAVRQLGRRMCTPRWAQ